MKAQADPNSPDPWLRQADWASGEIPDHIVGNTLLAWAFALIWNVGTAALVVNLSKEIRRGNHSHLWFAAIFLAIGIGTIIWVFISTTRALRFGKSTFYLQPIPAVPGGVLTGTIHISRPVTCPAGVVLNLFCVHRTRAGNQKRDGYFEENVWQTSQTVNSLPTATAGTDIPVYFKIPAGASPSNDSDPSSQIVWRLESEAKSGAFKYRARFDVPVFVTAVDGEDSVTAIDAAAAFRRQEEVVSPQRMHEAGINYRPLPGGGLQIHFAPARDKQAAMMLTFFGLVWTGIMIAMFYVARSQHWLVFRIVWYCGGVGLNGLIALIINYVAICSWLAVSDITVRRGSIVMRRGLLLFRRRNIYTSNQIVHLSSESSGSTGGVPFYAIELETTKQKQVRIADFIQNEEYAGWLASDIADRVGVRCEKAKS